MISRETIGVMALMAQMNGSPRRGLFQPQRELSEYERNIRMIIRFVIVMATLGLLLFRSRKPSGFSYRLVTAYFFFLAFVSVFVVEPGCDMTELLFVFFYLFVGYRRLQFK